MALTEFGGVPDIVRMRRLGIVWSYFASWTGEQAPTRTAEADIRRIYTSDFVSNLVSGMHHV